MPNLNLDVPLEHCETIIREIFGLGLANRSTPDVTEVLPLSPLWEGREYQPEALDEETGGITYRELVARYLYLRAPLDQGSDPEGVRMLLEQVTNRAYREDVRFLHEPEIFFDNIGRLMEIIAEEHEQVKGMRAPILRRERNVRAYSLFRVVGRLTLLTPHVMLCWGTPLANLMRFDDEGIGLLEWVQSHTCADAAALALRDDRKYGFGRAIGYKASRLFFKWLMHTYGIITRQDRQWGPNSYEIPLDSNVGRVLMRTGYIFPLVEGDPAETLTRGGQWRVQKDGRVNLSAQRLRDIRIPKGALPEIQLEALLEEWGLRNNLGERVLTRTLNAYLRLLLGSEEAATGVLDDGCMQIGTVYCYNTNPRCEICDVQTICWANTVEPALKRDYYCGTGEGVFFG